MTIDYQLFELINQFAGQNNTFDQIVLWFSKYGPILFGVVFVWLWFSKSENQNDNREIVLFALTIVIITLGIDKIIEMTYFRPRPYVNHAVTLLVEKSNLDPSFPSNHAAGSFALALALFWKRRTAGSILLISAFFMALSRVFIGVHYPLDLLAGAMVALAVTYVVMSQSRLLESPTNWVIRILSKSNSKKIG
ncbi:phosphatase PAP2 family protein [Sporosarcina sp. resist]|uniref:phosphatase PAP2 family protein n=1 Tax=Sporosarcina sp. resist TaxID=2762563 RepID=UPI00164D1142|nr:phosphatase PAP2 family protein [Sporosarcina sp. resist]QNK87144.1 phosphatase PAP2 family protein [Sporosarcina sp. resist]